MSKIERFEDIEVWQKARKLNHIVYVDIAKVLDKNKEFSLSDQIKRASVSIMANIAEGFARKSNKEFSRFLYISHASAAELQSHLYSALDIGLIKKDVFDKAYVSIDEVSKMLSGFIKYLDGKL